MRLNDRTTRRITATLAERAQNARFDREVAARLAIPETEAERERKRATLHAAFGLASCQNCGETYRDNGTGICPDCTEALENQYYDLSTGD